MSDKDMASAADRGTALSPCGSSPSVSPVPASIPDARVTGVIELLANFPANGIPKNTEAATYAILLGFIERQEVRQACRACGVPKLSYSYFRITEGGRLFLWAAQAIEAKREQA